MKTKLLTICLLLVTSQVFADDHFDKDGISLVKDYTENICHIPLSDLKNYEVALCQVFRDAMFQINDRKPDLSSDENYAFADGNTILGFTYEKKPTNYLLL